MISFTTLLTTVVAAASANGLGIKCRGSSLCVGNKGLLGEAQGQLRGMDQSKKLHDGDHAVCVQSSVTIGNPSLCVFYQNIGDRRFNKGQTLNYMEGIKDHGCRVCGSISTDDGNNVSNGQLTVNFAD